jgi:hypothetical protein
MRRVSADYLRFRLAARDMRPLIDASFSLFRELCGAPRTSSSRGPSRTTQALIDGIVRVFEAFDGSMSTRQTFYQLVSAGDIQNNTTAYDRVQRLLVDLRRDGTIPYERVVDRTRGKHQRAGWDGVEDLMNDAAAQFRRNFWKDQSTVTMVACEKQALEGIFSEVVDSFGASLWTLRGYVSEGFAYEWATDIQNLTAKGHDVAIAYFGDYDPSGLGIERDCQAKLERLGAEFTWSRCGLLSEDFECFNLVNVPVKRTDTRARAYLREHGNQAAELDALRPDELRQRIEDAIRRSIEPDAWERIERVERAERESLELVSQNWLRAIAGARG